MHTHSPWLPPSPLFAPLVRARLLRVDILVFASLLFLLSMVFTVAIGCRVVGVMKGPRFDADPFPGHEDAERSLR